MSIVSTQTLPDKHAGDYTLKAISDGYLTAGLDLLLNIDPSRAAKIQDDAGIKEHATLHINCYLARGRGRTILIDTGAGGAKGWGGGLKTNLSLAGVQPSEIDTILLTHAHPDHVGGLMDASGDISFPNAELVVHRDELAFWQDEGNLSRASERVRGNFFMARQAFSSYGKQIRTFCDGEVLPGIRAIPLPGHTDGHTGYQIESGCQGLLIWGDLVHFPQIQIRHPNVSIAFDQDPDLAAQTRSRLLDRICFDQLMVAGMHLDESGFARIEKNRGGLRALL